jgi:hypothetical protein
MTTSQQLADQAGITYRQLDNWVRRGWLKPTGSHGSGSGRYWPAQERNVALDMGRLCAYGLPPGLAHDLSRAELAAELLAVLGRLGSRGT